MTNSDESPKKKTAKQAFSYAALALVIDFIFIAATENLSPRTQLAAILPGLIVGVLGWIAIIFFIVGIVRWVKNKKN